MRARYSFTSCSDVSVPASNAALIDSTVAVSSVNAGFGAWVSATSADSPSVPHTHSAAAKSDVSLTMPGSIPLKNGNIFAMFKKSGGPAAPTLSGRRRAKLGSLASAHLLIVAGILGVVNFVAWKEHARWDLTGNQIFTLSDQTRAVLKRVTAPAKFLVFARLEDFDRFRSELREYQYLSKYVSVEYVDLDEKPVRAKQYQVETPNTVILEYQGRTERTTSAEEQDLTGVLVKAIEGRPKKAYFLNGHGEKDTRNSNGDGYSSVAAAMGGDNFVLDTLVLEAKDVPADAAVVIIAGPKSDLRADEARALLRYLAKGGKLLVLIDPPATAQEAPRANLLGVLRTWDIDVGANVVIDLSGMGEVIGTDATVPIAAKYPAHPITERFDLLSAFPYACSVTPIAGGMPGGYVAQTVVETSPRSFAEAHIAKLMSTGHAAFEDNTDDRPGPVSIAAAVSAKVTGDFANEMAEQGRSLESLPETHIAVFGDSDFISNATVGLVGNRTLFLKAVDWVSSQNETIVIPPRQAQERRLAILPQAQRRVFWFSMLIVPAFVLGTGVAVWWRRR